MTNELLTLRKKLDVLDKKIIKNLAERFVLTEQVGGYKKKHNLPAFDKKREEEIAKRLGSISEELGLDKNISKTIYKCIIKLVRERHNEIRKMKE